MSNLLILACPDKFLVNTAAVCAPVDPVYHFLYVSYVGIRRVKFIMQLYLTFTSKVQRYNQPKPVKETLPLFSKSQCPLLTHDPSRGPQQTQRRSRPRGSECSSSAGGTSPSPERNLGNRENHTRLIIKY